jgi:hypothetical protein
MAATLKGQMLYALSPRAYRRLYRKSAADSAVKPNE